MGFIYHLLFCVTDYVYIYSSLFLVKQLPLMCRIYVKSYIDFEFAVTC
jgi:hypothetical protein